MDRPTRPALIPGRWSGKFLWMAANRAAKKTIRFPKNSRRMASHLKRREKIEHENTILSSVYVLQDMKIEPARWTSQPVSTDTWVVGDLVVVHSRLTLKHEPLLLAISPDGGGSSDRLLEVWVDGGAGDGLQSLELTRRGHVEALWKNMCDTHRIHQKSLCGIRTAVEVFKTNWPVLTSRTLPAVKLLSQMSVWRLWWQLLH